MDCSFDEEKIQKFRDLGIPDNAFVITYFGRHNEIKGYDILKEVGMKLLKSMTIFISYVQVLVQFCL